VKQKLIELADEAARTVEVVNRSKKKVEERLSLEVEK